MDSKYDALAYPHSMHRRYVRGCEQCLARTKAAQARYTESRRRTREHNLQKLLEYEREHGCTRCGRSVEFGRHSPACDERNDDGR